MKNITPYIIEGVIWSIAGTLLRYFFDEDFVLWETMLMWFLNGIAWKYWMKHSFKLSKKNSSKP